MIPFRRRLNHISRTILLDGSPANRVAKWAVTFLITGVWIYTSEKKNPRKRGIFFRNNQAEHFENYEISEWNSKYNRDIFS